MVERLQTAAEKRAQTMRLTRLVNHLLIREADRVFSDKCRAESAAALARMPAEWHARRAAATTDTVTKTGKRMKRRTKENVSSLYIEAAERDRNA